MLISHLPCAPEVTYDLFLLTNSETRLLLHLAHDIFIIWCLIGANKIIQLSTMQKLLCKMHIANNWLLTIGIFAFKCSSNRDVLTVKKYTNNFFKDIYTICNQCKEKRILILEHWRVQKTIALWHYNWIIVIGNTTSL